MKLSDLTKDISKMSDDELREYVRQIRHNKTVVKPAHVKRVEEAVHKETKQKQSKISKAVSNMTAEEKKQLLLLLEGGEND